MLSDHLFEGDLPKNRRKRKFGDSLFEMPIAGMMDVFIEESNHEGVKERFERRREKQVKKG
ncbi:hypothetical protein H5410_028932 [Solanum commersonii]|uniref:Uncharacterized protein n=1 Tax=Solanum commersonii TaxID=4109 RepID=A0A9J5Z676_SOLCO|nr:hypothetical protein H5410_028932 [Solanum commersonii]